MKKNNLIILCLSFVACINSLNVFGQNLPKIDTIPSPPDSYQFEAHDMPVLPESAAFYTYLWWMGDNGFSFDSVPEYTFQRSRINTPLIVSMIGTGNYSTGGPPPIHLPMKPARGASHAIGLFNNSNDNLLVQQYRNAVIGDIMYLIVSYKIPLSYSKNVTSYSGVISVDMSQYSSVVTTINGGNNSFLPNDEVYNGNNSWSFTNLRHGEERSILIPIETLPNEEEHLNFDVKIDFNGHGMEESTVGINHFPLETTVAESHDPNQMIAHSNALNDCDYGGKPINYTVQFENIGDYETGYVKVVCLLDEKLDLNSVDNIDIPHPYRGVYQVKNNQNPVAALQCDYEIDHTNNSITFEFHGLKLLSPTDINCSNLDWTKEEVSFSINVLPNFRFGPDIISIAEITFDNNPVIETNQTTVTCKDPLSIADGGGFYGDSTSFFKDKCFIMCLAILLLLLIIIMILLKRRKK